MDLNEQAFLVGRGVRPLAFCGQCTPEAAATVLRELTRYGKPHHVIPVLAPRSNTVIDYGFASHQWVADLFVWVMANWDQLPKEHAHGIVGLLLGYSPVSTATFLNRLASKY